MFNYWNFQSGSLGIRIIVLSLAVFAPLVHAAPRILYTDIVTGPNTGGENDWGAYLTIFGSGFGAVQGTSQVTINAVPVAGVKQWSDSKVTVQPGPKVTSGVIGITVEGDFFSDLAITFTVVPGKIFFVSLTGSSNGVAGNIARPFRQISAVIDRGNFGPGDHIVVRGGTWSDVYPQYGSFFSIHHKGGTAAAPMVIMGYPTETVKLVRTVQTSGIHSYATPGHFVIANFQLDARGKGVGIGLWPDTTDVRVVNNEIFGFFEDSGGAAAISGSGRQYRILGNHLHDNGGSKLYHALYFDGRGTAEGGPNDIEIAYNHIHHQTGGRGIQIYGDTGTLINNVRVHHNLIHHIPLDAILLGRDSGTGFQVYNNVIYHTADPSLRGPTKDTGTSGGCLRFDSPQLVALVYNNTFSDCAVDEDPDSGAFRFQKAMQITLVNNIVAGKAYVNVDSMPATFASSHNLWFSKGGAPSWDTRSVSGDPRFADPQNGDFRIVASSPAIDRGSSSVSDVVVNDFAGVKRPQRRGYDMGAFELERLARPRASEGDGKAASD